MGLFSLSAPEAKGMLVLQSQKLISILQPFFFFFSQFSNTSSSLLELGVLAWLAVPGPTETLRLKK